MRPSTDVYMLGMALLASSRATCARRRVGCVLTNYLNHVLSTGYNGVPRGFDHCSDKPCPGATMPSGTGLDSCLATHAEQNALLQCRNVNEIYTCYCTASPCMTCTKLLLNTTCQRIVYLEEYPHADARNLWQSAGREWITLSVFGQVELQQLMAAMSNNPQLIKPLGG